MAVDRIEVSFHGYLVGTTDTDDFELPTYVTVETAFHL